MKKTLFCALLLLMTVIAFADIYTIGTGTSATSTNPFYGLYNYSWSKIIYTQAEISAAGFTQADDIIGVGFYVGNTPSSYTFTDARIYARHTNQTSYDTTDNTYPGTTGFSQLFQGDITFNGGGWHYVSFTANFEWNASQNIEFLFENWDGDLPTGYPTFRYTSTSSTYLTVYKGQDASFPGDLTGTRTYSRTNIALITPQTTPPQPAQAVYPPNGGTLIPPTAVLQWVSPDGFPDGYRLSLGTDNPPSSVLDNVDLGDVTSYNPDPDFSINTTYYWKVVPYNQFGDADNCPVWSFTTHGDATITQLPYFQHFDSVTAPALPFDWQYLIDPPGAAGAVVVTYVTSPHSTPNSLRMYNGTVATTEVLAIAPQLATDIPANTTRIRTWIKGGGSNYTLSYGVISDPANLATYTEVGTLSPTTAWVEYVLPLNGYTGTGRYVAFRHGQGGTGRTFYIDDFQLELIAADDLACLGLQGNVTPSVGTATTYNARIFNWGTNAQTNYTVKLFDSNDTELATAAGVTCAPGAEVQIPLVWTPTVQGPMSIYGKVFLTGDQNPSNDQGPNLNITVQSAGTVVVTVGEGNLAEGVPLEFYYRNSLFQCLYYPAELNVLGQITALAFYNNFVTNLPNMPCKFWLGSTDLADLSGGWILPGAGNLTLVYDGNIDFPSGENSVTIPLQTPYNYTGGNLVLYANRPYDTVYYSSSDNFRAQTVGTNRARKLYSDSVTYDPLNPSAAGTLSGTFPMTSISFLTTGYSVLNGTVTSGGNPLADVDIVINGTTNATTTNAVGGYNFPFVEPGAYTVTASKVGYESQTLPVTLIADETTTLNFALQPSTTITVTGTVVGSDQPTVGLEDADVSLSGIMNYTATTNANGQFTIPGVLSGNTYNYLISHEGYQDLTGSITVGNTNYSMGTLTLNEIAVPPGQVVAEENLAQTQVTITWRTPGAPGGPLMEFETDDGGWIPSSNWADPLGDFEWTNTYDASNYVVGGYPASEFPPPAAHSGTGLWGTVLYGPYTNAGGFSYLTKEFSFTGISNPQMRFWSWNNSFGNWDYGQVAVNGTVVWGPDWDTTPVEWLEVVIDLSAYANLANVSIQFQHYTTTVVNYAGWYIDDVYIGPAQNYAGTTTPAKPSDLFAGMAETEAARVNETRNLTMRSALPQNGRIDRVLEGYKVWRLLAADEGNENLWTLITPTTVTDTTYVDTAWGPLPSGIYEFAVKAVYSNNVLSAPSFSNEIHKGMMGVLTGTVTEFGTNVPIGGATITAGDYEGTSNAQGIYSFLVYQGTYDVSCSRAGYQTATQTGVVIVGTQTTTQNFVLTEITLPPGGVQATEATPNVNITWMEPGTGGGEWIHYDSGQNNDSIGTGAAADFDVAIRFPGSALTDYIGMNLYAVKVWPAQAGTFSVRVWTGGTATAPATMVVDQPFTPSPLDSYNTVVLNTPVAVQNQELWFGYRCNVTTGYPAGCDAGPQDEGFGNMIYWQGAWSTLTALNPDLTYNWNIQGYVGYSAPTAAPSISLPNLDDDPVRLRAGTLRTGSAAAGKVTRSAYPSARVQPSELEAPLSRDPDRTLEGYRVWRLLQGQETNENSWISLTDNPITATAYTDDDWIDLPDGSYKWAVKAIYTGGAASLPAFSNVLTHITQIGTIAGIVRTLQNAPIMGATITCGDVTSTTNASGAYSMQVESGTWSVTASHPNYQSVTHDGVIVVMGQTTTVNFQLPVANNLLVDGFESYDNFALAFAPWTLVDVDQSATYGMTGISWPNAYAAQAYMVFVPSATTPPVTDAAPHGGIKEAACFAATTPPNNDWLITPVLNGADQLRFWAKSYTDQYGLERFKVGVSTTGTNPANFTIISGASYIEAPTAWTEYTYDLSSYGRVPIYVGIQCVSNDAFIFFVDDVVVGGSPNGEDTVPVAATELRGNFPNPFNPTTTIAYSVKTPEAVTIGIFNVKGQLIRTLVNEAKEAGNHTVVWNGDDNSGRRVSSGIYYYKMSAGKYSSTRKMVMMK
jgi:hypothetical protein